MQSIFSGYYPPSADQYQQLWDEGLIVLDTNVLLNLYRLPTTARDELLQVLDSLKDRLWIPHQVALEFQRRRLTVIASERKSTEDALQAASDLVSELKRKVDTLQIDKRGLGIESQPLLDDLEKANAKLLDAIKAVHRSQLDISSSDEVREKLDVILFGKVGVGPKNQGELDLLVSDGDNRYKEKIPPGFADIDKDKNPNEASFIHDHIKYPRKYGDLILWRQLLNHAKENGIKLVLLVTADRKEDWWWREQGKTIGAHPELVREIQRETGVELFWIYSSVQFMEHANKYTTVAVSSESVAELQQVALSPTIRYPTTRSFIAEAAPFEARSIRLNESTQFIDRPDLRGIERSVGLWLSQTNERVEYNLRGFPDFLVNSDNDIEGFEVKYLRDFDRLILSSYIVNGLLRGYMEMKEGRLSAFTMVIVMPEAYFFDLRNSDRIHGLNHRIERLLRKYPITGIVMGVVLGESFEPLAHHRQSDLIENSSNFDEDS
ncbi:PIN domain-containing protein [Polaromonas sp.]|uniref:PIN-like domain-containing protein n=1 Tax=Polaromonas sp. TaxID=1869339 RepID=UPI0018282C84|nr:PIN domain-containing protein [Polaromonas sp.]NMM07418.1 DUF4935 domain-containing protein [Polaromonas sp.]